MKAEREERISGIEKRAEDVLIISDSADTGECWQVRRGSGHQEGSLLLCGMEPAHEAA